VSIFTAPVDYYYYYYYYYAAFNAPCVGHKADESQARGHVDLRIAVSVVKRFKFLFESICSDVQVASDDHLQGSTHLFQMCGAL